MRERLSAVDTAWLRMDTPGNLMMICGVLLLERRITRARLAALLDRRFLRFARFRQRPVEESGANAWQDHAGFDLDAHIVEVDLPAPARQRELQKLVSRLAGTPLDASRPLWQFHIVRNYSTGSALIVRIHHCYADGIALIQVMLSMTDASPTGPPALPMRARHTSSGDDHAETPPAPIDNAVQTASRIAATLVRKGVELWTNPQEAVALAAKGTALTREIATLALMRQDSNTSLKGVPTGSKCVAWADALSLDEVKAIGRALHASVNDVVLACAAGAFAAFLNQQGAALDGVTVRVLVPVNLRPAHEAHRLGNEFGLVFVDLPVHVANPVARLLAIRANMQALKGSMQPVLSMGLLAAMGAGPRALQDVLLQALARNATAVMTNVPGPQQRLYLAGSAIESLMFWVPQAGNIGVGASIISYDGKIQFGVVTDRAISSRPQAIARGFGQAFEALVLTTLMSPWPEQGAIDPSLAEAAVTASR